MKSYPLDIRAHLYNSDNPDYPNLHVEKGWLYGIWMIGAYYKNKKGYYGEFPHSFLERVQSMFPDREDPLHLFSGSLTSNELHENAVRVDTKEEIVVSCEVEEIESVKPDYVGNAENVSNFFDRNQFDFVLADPPYTREDAEEYGTDMPNRNTIMLNELPEIVKPGGYVCWLDILLPMFSKDDFNFCGTIGIVRSTNHRFRLLSIFERVDSDE